MKPLEHVTLKPGPETLPEGFDPREHPTIALHWFGLIALPRQDGAGDLVAVDIDEAA